MKWVYQLLLRTTTYDKNKRYTEIVNPDNCIYSSLDSAKKRLNVLINKKLNKNTYQLRYKSESRVEIWKRYETGHKVRKYYISKIKLI